MSSKPHLEHLAEFQKVLSQYHISDASKKVLASIKLALFVGPSASGRNTIIRELLKTGSYHFVVSDTTRKPRVNDGVLEQNGVEYWFRSEADVLADLQAGRFLEAALIHNQQVSGISLRELERARDEGKIAVNEVEIVGAHAVSQAKPDAYIFFVIPPSFDDWMKRMDGRGQMTADEKRRRLESSVKEFEAALQHDYYTFIVNDTLGSALEQIHRHTILNDPDVARQATARTITEHLLIGAKAYLAKR